MTYIDGFVIAVPTANKQKFIDHANLGDSVFMDLGAIRILECWGDDTPDGKLTDFRRAVQATPDETVVFSWIEWPDKATRDAAMGRMEELMKTDERMGDKNPMPFDGARMIYGGFAPVVTLEKPQGNRLGSYVWYEILTTDVAAAQAFYTAVLGWTFSDSGAPGMDYRIFNAGEHSIGGLLGISQDMAAHGAKPVWLGYISVDDVDAAVAAIRGQGGSVQMPPMDVPMAGRIAMVSDPQGAPFYVIKPNGEGKSLAFADDRPRPGHCAWNELATTDPAGAWTFYGEQFGWKKEGGMDMGPAGQYEFIRHGSMIGAIMPGEAGGRAQWQYYFRVTDIDAAKSAIETGGGKVVRGPEEIPGGEFSLNALDPQGAAFGLVGGRR